MDNSGLGLWDTFESDPQQKIKFEMDLGKGSVLHRNYESNHKPPFHEDPSGGIVVLALTGANGGRDLSIVCVRHLVALSNKSPKVSWKKFAKPFWVYSRFHVLHSRVVTWNNKAWQSTSKADGDHIYELTVYDFVHRFPEEVEVGKTFDRDPLVPVDSSPETYTIKFRSASQFLPTSLLATEGGICVQVRVYPRDSVLSWF